LLMVL